MSLAEVRKRNAEVLGEHDDPAKTPMPCPRCGVMSTRGELSWFGARCGRCYGVYVSELPPRPLWMEAKK